jgi:hypothetical protein
VRSCLRLLVVVGMTVTVVGSAGVPAAGQERAGVAPESAASPSPSISPSPGAGPAGRARPGFVVLLVLLALGLVWQIQRARRTTADVSRRSLERLERALGPDDEAERRGRSV